MPRADLGAKSGRHGLHSLPVASVLFGNAQLPFVGAGVCLTTIPAGSVHADTNGKSPTTLRREIAGRDRPQLPFANSDEPSPMACCRPTISLSLLQKQKRPHTHLRLGCRILQLSRVKGRRKKMPKYE